MKSAPTMALRVLVTLLAVVATVAQVAYLDALSWHRLGLAPAMAAQMRPPFVTLMTAHALVSIACAAIAVTLVLHEGPHERAARGLGLAIGAWSYLTAYSGVTLLLRDPGGARATFDAHFLAVEVVGLVGLIRFTSLFPKPLVRESLPPPEALPVVLRPFHAWSVWMLRQSAPWIAGAVVLGGLWALSLARGRPIANAGLDPVMDLVRFSVAGLVVWNLRRAWSHASGEHRGRLTWLLAALVFLVGALLIVIGGNVLMAVAGWTEPILPWRPLLMDVGLVGFLVGLAMSVLYRGPVDPAQTTRRIASVTTVATLGLFLAAALEALLSETVLAGFALRTGVGTILAFAIVLALHRGLLRGVERTLSSLPTLGMSEHAA